MALSRFVIPSPGLAGLNKEKAQSIIGPEWATVAQNAVVDLAGRFSARKGWVNQTSSAISGTPSLLALHEYVDNSGNTTLIAAGGNKLWESSDNGSTWTDRTGAVSVSADNWQLRNFNSKVIAAQASHALLVKTSGNFAAIVASSGSVPSNPIGVLCAFGRVWTIGSDRQTISYSALLDETKWATTDGAGTIDMRQVWTLGTDTITSIKAFSSRLIVFGRRHIVIWADGKGSALGIDPNNIYVEDCIEGQGTDAPDSVQNIGEGDLLFLGTFGIQSLVRILQEQKSPITDLTRNSRQYVISLLNAVSSTNKAQIKAVYSPEEGLYVVSLPSVKWTFAVDVRFPLPDGTYRLFEWPAFYPTSLCRRLNGDLLLGFSGIVGKYTGYQDNGSPYTLSWYSGYLDMQDDNVIIKELKSVRLLAGTAAAYTVTIRWGFDFQGNTNSATLLYTAASVAEYGIAQYGISEYGSSTLQHSDRVPGSATGQFLRIGVEVSINGSPFAISALHVLYEQGRIA